MNITILPLLRFSAAVIVILYHNKNSSKFLQEAPSILTAGPQMVTFFFVLSGFSLVLAYGNKKEFNTKIYLLKRLVRIAPIYFVALFMSVILIGMSGKFDPIAFTLNLFFLQSWIPPYPLTINGSGWFLSDLIFFYISFPIILIYLKKYSSKPIVILFSAILLWITTQIVLLILLNGQFYRGFPSVSHDLIHYFPLSHFCSFLLGASGAYVLTTNKQCFSPYRKHKVFLILSFFLFILIIENQSFINELLHVKLPYRVSFYAPLFLLFISSLYLLNNKKSISIPVKSITILGEISFSMYIMQSPVSRVTFHFLKRFNLSNEYNILIFISILIVISVFLFFLIERPIKERFFQNGTGCIRFNRK